MAAAPNPVVSTPGLVVPATPFGRTWMATRLALPILAQSLLNMMVGWSDTILTGQILGEERFLAAIALVPYLLWLMECFATVVSAGAQAVLSRLVGAGDIKSANEMVCHALVLALLLGVILLVGVVWGAPFVVAALQLEGEPARLLTDYFRVLGWVAPCFVFEMVATTCLRAAGETLAGLRIGIVVNTVVILAGWILTVGWGPIPALGWWGLAAGTSLGYVFGALCGVELLVRGRGPIRIPLPWSSAWPQPNQAAFLRVLNVGVPASTNMLSLVLCHLAYMSLISRLGSSALAAHGVALRCEELGWRSAEAIGIAGATLVGQSLGAKRVDSAWSFAWASLRLGFVVTVALGFIFFCAAEELFSLMVRVEQIDVFRLGVPVLQLVAFAEPALAATVILSKCMEGAGDTRTPLYFNTAGLVGVRLLLGFLLTIVWPLGLYGAWIAMCADLTFRGLAATWFFRLGRWSRIAV